MKRHATSICKIRKELRQRALKVINEENVSQNLESYEIPKLQRWNACDKYNGKSVYQRKIGRENLKDQTPSPLRKKFRSRRLTFDNIVDVCHRVIILKEF